MVNELQRLREDEVGVPGARALVVRAVVAPSHRHGTHAGSARGLDVAQVVAQIEAILGGSFNFSAASSNPAGCGLRCGVLSPHTTQSGLRRSDSTIRSVKRVALLVTMPQAMSRLSSSCRSSGMPGNRRVSTQTHSA